MEERHLSLGEVAELLDKSERTIRRWIKSSKLRAYKPGRDYLIPESAVREFIEESEVRPKAPAPDSRQPTLNGLLEEERRTRYQRSWRDFITLLTSRIQSEAEDKGYAPSWILQVDNTFRDITKALSDNEALGSRETYSTESEWQQSWEIFDALEELHEAVDQAWRVQQRETEHLERLKEADELQKRRSTTDNYYKKSLDARRERRSSSA